MATQKRKKLTLDEIETQMEVLTKEEMRQLKGGLDDIIVLFDTSGANNFGHTAVLIGDDSNGWRYYSKNGTESGSAWGSNYKPDLGTNVYSSLGSFLEEYKPRENKAYNYNRFVHIETSSSEDILANQVAYQHANSSGYNIFGSSCIDIPQEVIKAIYNKRYGTMGSFIASMSSGILIPREYLYELKAFYGDEITP